MNRADEAMYRAKNGGSGGIEALPGLRDQPADSTNGNRH